MMISRFAACVSLLVFAVSTLAATPTDAGVEATLKRQADAWDLAIIHKDRKAIDDNISGTFMQIGSDGAKADKPAFVTALMDKRLSIAPYTVEDFQIRVYGDTALLTGTTAMQGSWDGKAFNSHYRYTDVYVREHGKWRVVNVQTTPIP
ncbi:MAG: nuclear transport factor 2 family protein [Dokdonella sp.]